MYDSTQGKTPPFELTRNAEEVDIDDQRILRPHPLHLR